MRPEIFLAALAVLGAWIQYRIVIFNERKRILVSLRALLNISQWWIGTSYSEYTNKSEWFDPGKSVYKIDTSIIPNIISSNLIKKELSKQLSYFIQLVNRFNQRIDMYCQYVFSDIDLFLKATLFVNDNLVDDKKNYLSYENCLKKVENLSIKKEDLRLFNYLEKVYRLQKIIHMDGIGDEGYYVNENIKSKFPKLHRCYLELDCMLKHEELNRKQFLRDDSLYLIGDILLLIIPSIVVLVYILFFLDNFLRYIFLHI